MKLGYPCMSIGSDTRINRSFILKNFSSKRFYECVSLNLFDLKKILNYNIKNNIYMFRISSDIIPFGSHKINKFPWYEDFKDELISLGKFIKKNNIRISMHPGQYTVLNSPSSEIVNKSIQDIEYHCKFLDSLNIDYSNKIVLHIGGGYGDKISSLKRFENNFKKLSPSANKRLVLENDEKIFNIEDVLKLCYTLNIPCVLDNLHHSLNPGTISDLSKILTMINGTWKAEDGPIKFHYSDKNLLKKNGAHAKHVNIKNFFKFYNKVKKFDPDIMLEVKDKDISCIECVNSINFKDDLSIKFSEFAKYQYTLMEKDYTLYKEVCELINSDFNLLEFYKIIDKSFFKGFNKQSFKSTLNICFESIKDKCTPKEKEKFLKYISSLDNPYKTKNYLKKLCEKYKATNIIDSYYFKL